MTEHPRHPSADDALIFPARVRLERLDPANDPARFESTVRSITARAIAERATLARVGTLGTVASWSAPAFAAAAAVLVAAGVALALIPTPAVAAPVSFAETAGISRSLVQLSSGNRSPTPDELLSAVTAAATGAGR